MDHQTIGDIITSNIHRRCLHDNVENSADVSPMCLRRFEPWCNLPNVRRLLDVPMPWRSMPMTRVRRRSFAELLVHGAAAMAMLKFEYPESFGMLKTPRWTVE